ncbi:hypothetical protein BVG16_03005 [Paenibacillus selenitireducens]|uniref:Response regulatory domain-containing protein n=1 Tax=Paenibacillus selenitireducens TaxID=1324314 RepID=A0A1T2XN71_9BACL|nr:response regulator [Paenibacillus selenitireducens]OPA81301.1 hypothetical protein BVG16_03005 [Paenibacillus selenitireducens]
MSNSYSCVIAEENALFCQKLIKIAAQLDLFVMDTPSSGKGLIESVFKHKPDLIITDVLLKKVDGLSACKHLKEQGISIPIIIVSNSMDPAHYSGGFELESIDYINLPLSMDRFERAIGKAKKRIENQKILQTVAQKHKKMIRIKHKYRDMNIDEDEIVFIEKLEKRKYKIFLNEGIEIETSTNLEQIQVQCSEWVISPHRSFLVNLKRIKSVIPDPYIKGNYQIIYPTFNKIIPLTRRHFPLYLKLISSIF